MKSKNEELITREIKIFVAKYLEKRFNYEKGEITRSVNDSKEDIKELISDLSEEINGQLESKISSFVEEYRQEEKSLEDIKQSYTKDIKEAGIYIQRAVKKNLPVYVTEKELDLLVGDMQKKLLASLKSLLDSQPLKQHSISDHGIKATGSQLEELTGGKETLLHMHDPEPVLKQVEGMINNSKHNVPVEYLRVMDKDGKPIVEAVNTLKFTNGSITNKGSGIAEVDLSVVTTTAFLALTDTPNAYTTPNALYRVNNAGDAVAETTLVYAEPAANQFSLTRGTSTLQVEADVTLDQDLQISASPTFGGLTSTGNVGITIPNNGNVEALTIVQNDTTNNPIGINLTNAGTNDGLQVLQTGVLAASQYAINVYSNAVNTSSELIRFASDNANSTKSVLRIQDDGSSSAIFLDKNNSGSGFNMDGDANSASDLIGITMNLANAGAGDSVAFAFNGSELVSASIGGSQDKKVFCQAGGVTYYIALYTA